MLVIHPASHCDICLEHFVTDSQNKAPHAPRCGHVFCLSCLKSLSRRVCPMCRNPFHPGEVTRIHLDQRSSSSSLPSSTSGSPAADSIEFSDPSAALARELHDRINAFVSTGASTSVAHTLTDDCKSFFQDHAPTSYLDFYVTYQLLNHFLLGYYRAFFQDPAAADKSLAKFQAEVQAYHQSWENRYRRLTRNIEDLTEKLHLEVIAKENEIQERQTVEAVVRGLKDELQAQETWWHWKYDELRCKYSDLQCEVSELRGAQFQVMVAQCPIPNFDIEKKTHGSSGDTKENEPLSPVLPPFDKDWGNGGDSMQPPAYDYTTSLEGCLSIISTPFVDESSLRDEGEMKEMLYDILTDPLPTPRRVFNPTTHMNFTSRVPSSSKFTTAPQDSSRRNLTLTSSISTTADSPMSSITAISDSASLISTTTDATLTNEFKPAQTKAKPFAITPEPPLWTRKRSLCLTPYARDHARDLKGKATTSMSMSRSLSASEVE